MKRAVLFQFHQHWDVCAERLRLLRTLNPEATVFGLFGGEPRDLAAARHLFDDPNRVFEVVDRSAGWKWQNTDLCVREWFRTVGHRVSFDVLHVLQWDLLLCSPLSVAYSHIPADAIGLTGLIPLATIEDRWYWTTNEPQRTDSRRLLDWASREHGELGATLACLGPGYVLPRRFIEEFARFEMPEFGHDELRLPLFARILGCPLADTRFYPAWFDAPGERLFNANGDDIDMLAIAEQLRDPQGRRAFHPVRQTVPREIEVLIANSSASSDTATGMNRL